MSNLITKADLAAIRSDLAALHAELRRAIRRRTIITIAGILAGTVALATVARALGVA